MSDTKKYAEIFDYLGAPTEPTEALPTVVFGRQDPIVAYRAGELAMASLVDVMVITGGIGKDSGNLLEEGYRSEAGFLDSHLKEHSRQNSYALPRILLEEKANNGGANARNSLEVLTTLGYSINVLTAVTHATSLRRLSATIEHEAIDKHGTMPVIYKVPSRYQFDPTKPKDREEAAAELLRLADWPAQGLLPLQHDLPYNLVDFVRERHGKSPKPISPRAAAVISHLPPSFQARIYKFAASHGRK